MNIKEFHYDFKVKIDKVDSLSKRNFNVAEIDWILNEAILLFVKERYGITNIKQQGFETSQKRISDLNNLVVKCPTIKQPALIPNLVSPNLWEVDLKDLKYPYLFLIRGECKVSKSNCAPRVAILKQIPHDDLSTSLTNPFYKPSFLWQEVLTVFGRNNNTPDSTLSNSVNQQASVYMYTDDFAIDEVYLEYIKYPNKVSIGGYTYLDGSPSVLTECDLAEETHKEIVDIAVTEASRIIEDPEFIQLKERKLQYNE